MTVKKSIFGSKAEAQGFQSIEHTWGEDYRLIPQFLFSGLFEPDNSIKNPSNLFFKTSIDYVLSTKEGQPLLAIDFDGLGKGFDREGQYVPVEATRDPYRKPKFDFKLRYSQKNDFPYYIISYDEFEHLDDEIELTVVDGIIGSTLAGRDFNERIQSVVDERERIINNLPSHEQHEYIRDLVISEEIESDFAFNPIIQRTAEVRDKIYAITGSYSWKESIRSYEEPTLPDLNGPGLFGSAESLQARANAMSKVEWWGCVHTLSDTPIGEVSDIAWIRNAGHSHTLVREIAELLAYSMLLKLLIRRQS